MAGNLPDRKWTNHDNVHEFRWQKKLQTSILPFQVFEGFIQKQNNFSNPMRALLENSLCTLADLNHRFGGPLDISENFWLMTVL